MDNTELRIMLVLCVVKEKKWEEKEKNSGEPGYI